MPCLPALQDVRELFATLLRRRVSVTHGPAPEGAAVAGMYADDRGVTEVMAIFDLALAARAGAALSVIPVGIAEESILEGRLAQNLLDNLAEVLNVANGLFNDGSGPHLKLREVQPVTQGGRSGGSRLDVHVNINGYGGGALSLVVLA